MASFLTCCCSQFPVWLRTFKSICMFIAQGLLLHVVCMHADKLYVKDFLVFQVKFWLAKKGFMKQFEGSWRIQPFYIDAEGGPAPEDNANRVASIVFLQQVHNLLSPTTETSGIFWWCSNSIFDDDQTVSLWWWSWGFQYRYCNQHWCHHHWSKVMYVALLQRQLRC